MAQRKVSGRAQIFWKSFFSFFLFSGLIAGSPLAYGEDNCTTEIAVQSAIGPAVLDLFDRAVEKSQRQSCRSVLLLLNTPGGSLQTTRLIVERILNSPIPFLCLVAPSGGHAGSAGAIILQACHVNGALRATNLGAATPISGDGQQIPEDLRKKLINDTKSWLEGLTQLRGRNLKFSEEIVTEARAVSAEEAKKIGAIDTVVDSIDEFLQFAEGREVKLSQNQTTQVEVGARQIFVSDFRFRILDLLTDPQTSYLILMGSLALIYFEVTHPGTLVAGTIGGIGLVISLMAMHKLNVEWGGLALILVAIILLVAEAFVPSFGVLGVGGIVSFVLGSLFLYDPAKTGGYTLPLSIILPTAAILAAAMIGIGYMVLQARKVKKSGGYDDLIGQFGRVVTLEPGELLGQIEVHGETWAFEAKEKLQINQKVKIVGHEKLTLKVTANQEA